MADENEAIGIYCQLVADGYLVKPDGDCWIVTEPNTRAHPQQARAIRSMREALKWAEGVEAIRFVTGGRR